MTALSGTQRRRVQAGATTSHLSAAAGSTRKGTPVRFEFELADRTRIELELVDVVSWGVTRQDDAPAEPALYCTPPGGPRRRARLARLMIL